MPVLVSRSGVQGRSVASAELCARAERMLAALELSAAELSVLLCDDATIHALNRQHRKKDKPTDVLAFALREGKLPRFARRSEDALRPGTAPIRARAGLRTSTAKGRAEPLGDVVISLDTARRQAEERGRTLWDEVTLLLAHGLLHLIGYDHRTRAEERVMNARADMLVAAASSARSRSNTPKGVRAAPARRSDVDKRSPGIARRPPARRRAPRPVRK